MVGVELGEGGEEIGVGEDEREDGEGGEDVRGGGEPAGVADDEGGEDEGEGHVRDVESVREAEDSLHLALVQRGVKIT